MKQLRGLLLNCKNFKEIKQNWIFILIISRIMQPNGSRKKWLPDHPQSSLSDANSNHKNVDTIQNLQTLFDSPSLLHVHVITAKDLEAFNQHKSCPISIAWYGAPYKIDKMTPDGLEHIRTLQLGSSITMNSLWLSDQEERYPDLKTKVDELRDIQQIKS